MHFKWRIGMKYLVFYSLIIIICQLTIRGSDMEKVFTAVSDKEGYIPVKGGNIWYKVCGADKDGVPLLIIHGGPGAPHDYLETLESLASERPVIFYDQLGCGNSDRPSDTSLWTLERFVDELETVRNTLAPGRVHLLGQSWGSMLAVEYMIVKKPREIVSLIMSGPAIDAQRFASDAAGYLHELPDEMQAAISECDSSGDYSRPEYQNAVMEFYKKHLCMLDVWPECMDRTFRKFGQESYEYMWGPSEFRVTGVLSGFDRTGSLHELNVPVLYTCGRYDEATPAATMYYSGLTPGSQFYIFEGASHQHHLEKPEEYLKVTGEFLKSRESR